MAIVVLVVVAAAAAAAAATGGVVVVVVVVVVRSAPLQLGPPKSLSPKPTFSLLRHREEVVPAIEQLERTSCCEHTTFRTSII